MRHQLEGFAEDITRQRDFVAERVPVYGALLDLVLAHAAEIEARLAEAWRGRSFMAWYERPLLLLASLRYDALSEGATHPLYPALVDADLRDLAIERLLPALAPERARCMHALRLRAVQTNETSRAIAWLLPASILTETRPGAALALADMGASAGLNLAADRLPRPWRDEHGADLPCVPLPDIVARWGYDVAPLDASNPDHARWLEACVWPGEHQRPARLAQAFEAFTALRATAAPPHMLAVRARDMPARLEEACARLEADVPVLAYQTVVRDYLPADERNVYEEGMRTWLTARPGALWVQLEASPHPTSPHPFAISVHALNKGEVESLELARCGPHPSVLAVDEGARHALRRILSDA
jgi:hypothetical protein